MLHIEHRLRHDIATRLRHAGLHASAHVGVGVADVELAAGDVERPAVKRDALGQARDGVLGCRVGDRHRPRHVRRDRAVVDDTPALRLLFLEHADRFLRTHEAGGQVEIDDALPLLEWDVLHRSGRQSHAGVVEQEIQASEGFFRLGEQLLDIGLFGDVGGDADHFPGPRFCHGDGLVQFLLAAAGDDDVPAVGLQMQRCGAADAGAAAGDDCNLVRCHDASFRVQNVAIGVLECTRSRRRRLFKPEATS